MSDNQHLPAHYTSHVPELENQVTHNGAGYADDEETSRISPQRILLAARRYKWLVLALVIAGTTGALYMSRNVPRIYVAEATLYFEMSEGRLAGPIQTSELLRHDAWVSLLRSYTLLERVVLEEKLYLRHSAQDAALFADFGAVGEFAAGTFELRMDASGRRATLLTPEGEVLQQVQPGDAVGVPLGFRWTPPASEFQPNRSVVFSTSHPREAARRIANSLDPRMMPGNSFLTVTFRGTNPAAVTRTVNAVAERYVEVAAELKRSRVVEQQELLGQQLARAEAALAQAEAELQNFQVQTITKPQEYSTPITPGLEATRAPALSNYFQLTMQREELQRDRNAIQQVMPGSGSGLSVDALAAIPSVRNSPELMLALNELTTKRSELRTLRQVYTAEHADVRAAMEEIGRYEQTVVPALALRLVQELDARAGSLEGLIRSASGELREIPTRAIDEARLRRNFATAENLYNDLKQRHEAARLGAETAVPDVQIFDRASIPTSATKDPRRQYALMGFAGSLALGLLLAVMLDRMDPRVRYAEQITGDMRLAIIGAIPNVKGSRRAAAVQNAEVVEAFRGIRLNLMYAYGSAGPLMLTVSSPGPGDGKTFLSSNLALAFADLGMRTLLIDGDTRRGQQHRLFNIERRPGLTDYLAGEIPAEDAIQTTHIDGVDVIPGGARRADSPELLQSPKMSELLARIKQRYQVILVDSPPLGAGVDPLLLGALTGNILLVMRNGTTDRQLAESKLQMLDRLPIRVLGAVLNGVEQGQGYRYYSYLSGYESGGEGDVAERKVLEPA